MLILQEKPGYILPFVIWEFLYFTSSVLLLLFRFVDPSGFISFMVALSGSKDKDVKVFLEKSDTMIVGSMIFGIRKCTNFFGEKFIWLA